MDSTDLGSLSALFARHSSNADRIRALRNFGIEARDRLSAAAAQGRDLLAPSAQLLKDVASRLPVRDADVLRRLYGDDPEIQSQQVIADAGRLGRFLWTGAAVVPGPPPVVRAVKVVLHSAIEVRMIGELYGIHGGPADRDASWIGAVLLTWASGQPVAPGGSVPSTTATLAAKMRTSASELIGSQSRAAVVASRGREGGSAILRTGSRMHRRMRLHPSLWATPSTQSTGAVVLDTVGKIAADGIARRLPLALENAARSRIQPAASEQPIGATTVSGPRGALAAAWALHQLATAATFEPSGSDPVLTRLHGALAAQERHLRTLSRSLGQPIPHIPEQRRGDGTAAAARLVWQAEEAIDAVEEMGTRSRRLPSWSTRRRAALVYLITALIVSALPVITLLNSAGLGMIGLLLAQCLALPWLSLAIGAIAIGLLFRPWLGGPVPRHPVIGTSIVLCIHVGSAVLAAVSALLT